MKFTRQSRQHARDLIRRNFAAGVTPDELRDSLARVVARDIANDHTDAGHPDLVRAFAVADRLCAYRAYAIALRIRGAM